MPDVMTSTRGNKNSSFTSPTVVGSGDLSGTDWSNAANILRSNNLEATVTLASGVTSNYIVAQGFYFDKVVPDNANVVGLEFQVEKSGLAGIEDNHVYLWRSGVMETTQDKRAAGNWPGSGAFTNYGSSTDRWGLNLTHHDVNNDRTLGLAIACINNTASGDSQAYLDNVQCRVHYQFEQKEATAISYVNVFGNTKRIVRTNVVPSISGVAGRLDSRLDDLTYYQN